MSHRTTASAASDDPLAGLLTLQQQQARVPHLFPSLDSIRWFVRRNRAVLQQHHVLLEIAGRTYVDPDKFAAVVLVIGAAQSASRVEAV